MSNPLDRKEFKHYLNFLSDDLGMFQITEPNKFDASEFVIESDNYARDISFMNEEVSLEFYEGLHELADAPYQMLDGTIQERLGHCLDYILDYNTRYGFQAHIEYILERNGVQFVLGELNFEGCDTDELTYFKCKVVQSTKRALARRRDDTTIDGFSNEDLDGNYIEPLETVRMLLKAKPFEQESNFESGVELVNERFFAEEGGGQDEKWYYYNICNSVINGGVEDTLSYLENVIWTLEEDDIKGNLFPYVEALNELSDIKITIKNISLRQDIDTDNGGDGFIETDFRVAWGTSMDNLDGTDILFSQLRTDSDGFLLWEENELVVNIPFLGVGKRIFIFFKTKVRQSSNIPSGNPRIEAFTTLRKFSIDIESKSTAIDTVINATRYGDVLKHSLKAINGMDIIAPEFEVGGELYNLFCFSGNLIRQRDDVPFYFDFKDRKENFQALFNGDVQINEESAFAIHYDKFYDDVENGVFLLAPNDEYLMNYNSDYAKNILEVKFKDYEKDDDEENTLSAAHTESQWSINNTRTKGDKKIEIGDIFDPFKIEAQRRKTFKETTALDGDDKIHCMDAVTLAPNTRGGFSANMTHYITSDGRVKLLKNSNLPSWSFLGFNVGTLDFKIIHGANVGTYEVEDIEDTIITLRPISPSSQFYSGYNITTVSYPYENVLYQNRTNEGFDIIENIISPNNFGNLRFTIRHCIAYWESYINTCASYISDDIKNTEFINNGSLVTQFQGGPIYTENGDITLASLSKKRVTPRVYDQDVIVEYDEILSMMRKYQTLETVGGYIRLLDNHQRVKKVYPKTLKYTWATKVLNIIGEEKAESELITVYRSEGIIYVDETPYTSELLDNVNYIAENDYFAILDNNQRKIINFTKYDRFIVQEETFDNPVDLAQALTDL